MFKEIQTDVLDSVSLEKEHSSFSAEEDFFCTYTKKHLYKNLSSRQVQILELRQKHPELTYAEIGKRFGVRGPTIVRDVQLAKETYNKLFGTNFQIGRQKQNI
jgi:DNA-directed RNA polymerase specialized sigma24 family protein